MCKCKYERAYYDYEYKTRKEYRCDRQPIDNSDHCIFHDPAYWRAHEKEVREAFYNLVREAIDKGEPLYCIGFNLPRFDINDLKKDLKKRRLEKIEFSKPVYFNGAVFQRADFSQVTFQKADFSQASFQKAIFLGTSFQEAIFSIAKFDQKADFSQAVFQKADFSKTSFQQATIFSGASFQEAYFSQAEFDQKVTFSQAVFTKADFSKANFTEAIFSKATFQEAIFSKAVFKQKAIFSKAKFNQSNFSQATFQEAIFSNSVFNQRADFSIVEFYKQATFSQATFQEAIFFKAVFKQKAIFSKAVFNQSNFSQATFNQAIFREAEINQSNFSQASFRKADFSRAVFKEIDFSLALFKESNFTNVTFLGHANFGLVTLCESNFSDAVLNGNVDFKWTIFPRFPTDETFKIPITFRKAIFNGKIKFIGASDVDSVNLQRRVCKALVSLDKRIKHLEAREPLIELVKEHKDTLSNYLNSDHRLDLSGVSFLYVDLTNAVFYNVKWGEHEELPWYERIRQLSVKILRNEKIDRLAIKRSIIADEHLVIKGKKSNYEDVAAIYAELRRNYEKRLRFNEAADFFIGEMENRKNGLREEGGRKKIESYVYSAYKWLALYGESMIRPLSLTMIVIPVLALIRYVLGVCSIENCYNNPWEYLIDSAAAYFQLPRSDPINGADLIERVISIPILGTLFIALKRKLERKSELL